jgi:hypothetical protein
MGREFPNNIAALLDGELIEAAIELFDLENAGH